MRQDNKIDIQFSQFSQCSEAAKLSEVDICPSSLLVCLSKKVSLKFPREKERGVAKKCDF